MEKIFVTNKIFYFLFFFIFLIVDLLLAIEKKATFMTFLLILLIFFNKRSKINSPNFLYKKNHFNNFFVFIYLMLLTTLTQNYLLNIEIIDWDIPSYIVASNPVMSGYLPYELQWESKGPVLFYIYGILINFVNGNYLYFKLVNDVVLALISFILFLSIKTNNRTSMAVISSTFFVIVFSQPWALSGYSELYCLLFISISYFVNTTHFSKKYYLVGFLLSISTLINQGTILFAIPFAIKYLLKNDLGKFFKFFIGSIIPYIFFTLLFIANDLVEIFLATYFTIPIEYTSANYSNFYELRVFLRKYFEFNSYIYYLLISVAIKSFYTVFTGEKVRFSNIWFDSLFVFMSFAFYFIGGHNYYHHLYFLLFFISLFIQNFTNDWGSDLIIIFLILSVFSSLFSLGGKSVNHLSNIDEVYDNYPIKNLAEEADSFFEGDYEVFALEYNLILHYLNKNNFSYIVHHTNFLEPYIMSALEDIGYIEQDYINFLLEKKPDVVICSEWMIVRGDPIKNPIVNCSNDIFDNTYIEIDTDEYFTENLNYYFDPYKKIKVFIKTN